VHQAIRVNIDRYILSPESEMMKLTAIKSMT